MTIYEIEQHIIDDYFVEHFYTFGIFLNKKNAEKKLEKLKLKYKGDKYAKDIKIRIKETED